MSNTSTNINARIFSPYVVVGGEEKTRLLFTLKDTEGYTISAGITVGDVIRYSPGNMEYTRSKANSDENAEVVGVVESISGGSYNVVGHGSIKYPAARLNAITQGGVGGIDVLFLDATVDGGLTGTIDISSGEEKLVKPVLQIAPHGEYNARVLNHIGYKTGNKAVLEVGQDIVSIGSILFLPKQTNTSTPNNYVIAPAFASWTSLTAAVDLTSRILYSDYPDFYDFLLSNYSNDGVPFRVGIKMKVNTPFDPGFFTPPFYPYIGTLVVTTSQGEQLSYTSYIDFSSIPNQDTNYIVLNIMDTGWLNSAGVSLLSRLTDSTNTFSGSFEVLIASGEKPTTYTLDYVATTDVEVFNFVPPPIPSSRRPTFSNSATTTLPALAYYKAKKDSFLVRVPTELTIDTLKIDSSLELTGTNLETRLAAIESRLANICSSIGLGC